MTERRAMELFETRFAQRARAYTDPATERRFDALAMARTAMSSEHATGWLQRRPGAGQLGRQIGARWAVAVVAVAVIGVVGAAVLGRPSDFVTGPQPSPAASSTQSPVASAGGPLPDILIHSWQRPYAVTPDLDQWATGFLTMASGLMDYGPEPGAAASRAAISAAAFDTLVATATAETRGCAIGDIGTYRWSVEGKGTVMSLTAIGADACAPREATLAGSWVRADLPVAPSGETLPPGTYVTSAFDPFGAPGASGQLSYAVPDGWKVKEDRAGAFVLHHLADDSASPPSTDTFIQLFTQARLMADYPESAICGQPSEAASVGREVPAIVDAIVARPGVVSTKPAAVTIGGFDGFRLDLNLAPNWTGGCHGLEGPIVSMPLLLGPEFERSAGVGLVPDSPFRLILLDLGFGRTMAIAIYSGGRSEPAQLEAQVADGMPIIESFEFHPPAP